MTSKMRNGLHRVVILCSIISMLLLEERRNLVFTCIEWYYALLNPFAGHNPVSVICENDAKLSLPMHIGHRRLVLHGAGSHKFVPVSVILNPECLDHIGSARSQFPSSCPFAQKDHITILVCSLLTTVWVVSYIVSITSRIVCCIICWHCCFCFRSESSFILYRKYICNLAVAFLGPSGHWPVDVC